MADPSLLILPGDGIGPEVMAEVRKVIAWFGRNAASPSRSRRTWSAAAPTTPTAPPLTDATMARAQAADAVLLGAVGGPKWDDCLTRSAPEAGLLRLRKEMELFANLRPAKCFDALADFSSLKRELVEPGSTS